MNKNVEILEDNAGGLTFQDMVTGQALYFEDPLDAKETLEGYLQGEGFEAWEESPAWAYIEYPSLYTPWDREDVEDFLKEVTQPQLT